MYLLNNKKCEGQKCGATTGRKKDLNEHIANEPMVKLTDDSLLKIALCVPWEFNLGC